jgi:hypothetical protein
VLVPLEFAFPLITQSYDFLSYLDYIIDACFFFDVALSFRTIYFDPKSEEPITDQKKIAF